MVLHNLTFVSERLYAYKVDGTTFCIERQDSQKLCNVTAKVSQLRH